MDELVQRLAQGSHPVAVGGPVATLEEFQRRVTEIGYAFIKFTDTRGGTDLGVEVDAAATDLSKADFLAASGTAHVEGSLSLNYVKVRCIADIDLASLQGTGHLDVVDDAAV